MFNILPFGTLYFSFLEEKNLFKNFIRRNDGGNGGKSNDFFCQEEEEESLMGEMSEKKTFCGEVFFFETR